MAKRTKKTEAKPKKTVAEAVKESKVSSLTPAQRLIPHNLIDELDSLHKKIEELENKISKK